jgi:DNA-binding NarL/FixJ family response regulator
MPIKLLIADDDSLIRESLRIILGMEEDFEIAGTVENGLQAVERCIRENIDVALLDVRMPVMNGVQAVKEIAGKTNTKTLILTTFDDDEFIMQAIRNGAKGYLLKNNAPDKIKDAIRLVYGGSTVMQDVVMEKVKLGLTHTPIDKIDLSLFTQREIEIIEAIAEGLSNREISQKLFISEGTVKNYISSILDKTELEHRTQIAIYYIKGIKKR